ncbi:hypothetical protein HaLaN_28152 [Haematococcus lacustris]|uniref:Uncharacterized protein n=1 Tax=Haematococcus lacustris TaxID=44745 RepID=A0A6A0AA34_HAELA|nr:hypothetical protein HaLaN_28152 [Haematococcus lacustris]
MPSLAAPEAAVLFGSARDRYWSWLQHSCFCTAQAGRAAAHQRPDKLEAGHCKGVVGGLQSVVGISPVLITYADVDESCLAACTQLTRLECPNSFPGLSQLTQLRRVGMHEINSLSAVTVLASLPHLDHLRLGSWVSPDQLGSSQPFIFPSLTCLKFVSVNASFLAAMGCPKLLHLGINEEYEDGALGLVVDSAPSLRACADGILQHCSYVHLTRKPGVALTDVLEALAPWQPSAAALSSSCHAQWGGITDVCSGLGMLETTNNWWWMTGGDKSTGWGSQQEGLGSGVRADAKGGSEAASRATGDGGRVLHQLGQLSLHQTRQGLPFLRRPSPSGERVDERDPAVAVDVLGSSKRTRVARES